MDRKTRKKLKNLTRNFGFEKSELGEICKMYLAQPFDTQDLGYQKLLRVSKEICQKYSQVCDMELQIRAKNKKFKISGLTYLKFYFKKLAILKKIFPIHGFILYAERGLEAVIGLVDLKGYGFINRNVRFLPNSLTKVEKGVVFAMNIQVGDALGAEKVQSLQKIVIAKNCWICAGCKILPNKSVKDETLKISQESVLGCGAEVLQSTLPQTFCVGRPAKEKIKIGTNFESPAHQTCFSSAQKQMILQHVAAQNFGKFPKEFEKMLDCQYFNSMSKSLGYLYRLTKNLCFQFNSPTTSQQTKQQILQILFPNHGKNFTVGQGLHLDMLGTVLVGDNVTIGSNATIGGNIILQDGCKIGDNCTIFASGHSMQAKKRKMNFSLKKGFYEDTKYGFVIVESNVQIGSGTIVAPNSIVQTDVPQNSLFVKNKII